MQWSTPSIKWEWCLSAWRKQQNRCESVIKNVSDSFLIDNIILQAVAETRKSVRDLENYKEIDKFNQMEFEKNLIAASRIKYDDPAGLRAKLIYTDI